jgi:hypothetical protein
MAFPPNYQGLYSNGVSYSLGATVLTDGNPYGINGAYYIRITNGGNPGYAPGYSDNWEIYTMPKGIDGAGSITGSGDIS